MKKFLIFVLLFILAMRSNAQSSNVQNIIGTWHLDSMNFEGFSDDDKADFNAYKQYLFFIFGRDSTFAMPDMEQEPGSGDLEMGTYYLVGNELFVRIGANEDDDFEAAEIVFLREDYIKLTEEGESMFFKKE
jgi:hypothetical protein